MAENIKIEVVTPDKAVVNDDAQIVMAPGVDGEFGVLSGHTPFLTTLKIGRVHYTDINGNEHSIFVNGGFAEALPTKVTILAESSEISSDIDVNRAKASFERAQERLAKDRSNNNDDKAINFVRAKAALLRAIERIRIAES